MDKLRLFGCKIRRFIITTLCTHTDKPPPNLESIAPSEKINIKQEKGGGSEFRKKLLRTRIGSIT